MPRIRIALLSLLLLSPSLCGQLRPGVAVRQRLDDLFRGGPMPARVEWNGSIVDVAELTQKSTALGGEPELHDRELLILAALTEELRRSRQLPSDAELDEAFETYRQPYDSTPFTVAVVATKFKGYPSREAFVQRWRVMHAFTLTLGQIDRKVLQDEADAQRGFFGDGLIQAELWFFSARKDAEGRWDFAAAEARAQRALADLRAGKDEAEVRRDSDEIGQAAPPPRGAPLPAVPAPGARGQPYNQLRTRMGESEYTDLILGASAADAVWQQAKVGELTGPLRGLRGYWLARVGSRSQGREVKVADNRIEELVREVYVQRRFREWAGQVLERTVLRVPKTQ